MRDLFQFLTAAIQSFTYGVVTYIYYLDNCYSKRNESCRLRSAIGKVKFFGSPQERIQLKLYLLPSRRLYHSWLRDPSLSKRSLSKPFVGSQPSSTPSCTSEDTVMTLGPSRQCIRAPQLKGNLHVICSLNLPSPHNLAYLQDQEGVSSTPLDLGFFVQCTV